VAAEHHFVGRRIELGVAAGRLVQRTQRALQIGHAQARGFHPLGAGVLGLDARVTPEAHGVGGALLTTVEQPRVAREAGGKGRQLARFAGRVGAEHAIAVADGSKVIGADDAPQLLDAVAGLCNLVEAAVGHDRGVGPETVGKLGLAHLRHGVGGGRHLVVHQTQGVADFVRKDIAQQRADALIRQRQLGGGRIHARPAEQRPVVLAEETQYWPKKPITVGQT